MTNKSYDPNLANMITAAEMIYALKTAGAARFALQRSDGEAKTAKVLLEEAGELLKDEVFQNNPAAADYLVAEAIQLVDTIIGCLND